LAERFKKAVAPEVSMTADTPGADVDLLLSIKLIDNLYFMPKASHMTSRTHPRQ
jgi:hypothetical protein